MGKFFVLLGEFGDMDEHISYRRRMGPRFEAVLDGIESLMDTRGERTLRIVEVGATPFVFTEMLVDRFPEAEIIVTGYGDSQESEVINGRDIPIHNLNVEEDTWPFDDTSVDVITFMAIIEHLFDPLTALMEARRVLDHGGRFFLTTPNAIRLEVRLRTMLGENPYDPYALESPYNRHQHEFTMEELEDLLPTAGLFPTRTYTVPLDRTNLIPILFQKVTEITASWGDQIIVEAEKGDPEIRLPEVYRQGLTESRTTHPAHERITK
jgi:SAM-dependent methyltransferase